MRKGKRIKEKEKDKEKEKWTERPKNTPAPPFHLSPFRHSRRRRILSISPFTYSFSFTFTYSFTLPFNFTFTFVFSYSFALSSTFAFLLLPSLAAAAPFDPSGEGEEIRIFIFDRTGERFCEKGRPPVHPPKQPRRSTPARRSDHAVMPGRSPGSIPPPAGALSLRFLPTGMPKLATFAKSQQMPPTVLASACKCAILALRNERRKKTVPRQGKAKR